MFVHATCVATRRTGAIRSVESSTWPIYGGRHGFTTDMRSFVSYSRGHLLIICKGGCIVSMLELDICNGMCFSHGLGVKGLSKIFRCCLW